MTIGLEDPPRIQAKIDAMSDPKPNFATGPTLIGPNLARDGFVEEEAPLPEPPDFEAETIFRRKRGTATKPKTNTPRMSGINL